LQKNEVMKVRILFFGVLKDIVGGSDETLVIPEKATLEHVLAHYRERNPRLRDMLPSIAMSVNREYASPDAILSADDEIALLPPVSGGTAKARITKTRIEAKPVVEGIQKPEDGALVIFEGVVRNNTRGRRTLYLDYECYEAMALAQMEALVAEALERFAIRDAAIVHRVGRLEVGETSVLIVVASAHRGAAFDASRWLIDTLKRRVPVWKKEYFEDGAVWADGEPFPAEIARAEGTVANPRASK
jgi:MoaE-MoaD fusion protein